MKTLLAIFLFGMVLTGFVALGLIFALSFEEPEERALSRESGGQESSGL